MKSSTEDARAFAWIVVILATLMMLAIALGGCTVELDDDCEPGSLLCACDASPECDGYGVGGLRGACVDGLCTVECDEDSDCEAHEAAICGEPVDRVRVCEGR